MYVFTVEVLVTRPNNVAVQAFTVVAVNLYSAYQKALRHFEAEKVDTSGVKVTSFEIVSVKRGVKVDAIVDFSDE